MCSVQDCLKANHKNTPTRCWAHRAQKYATEISPVVEVASLVEASVEPAAEDSYSSKIANIAKLLEEEEIESEVQFVKESVAEVEIVAEGPYNPMSYTKALRIANENGVCVIDVLKAAKLTKTVNIGDFDDDDIAAFSRKNVSKTNIPTQKKVMSPNVCPIEPPTNATNDSTILSESKDLKPVTEIIQVEYDTTSLIDFHEFISAWCARGKDIDLQCVRKPNPECINDGFSTMMQYEGYDGDNLITGRFFYFKSDEDKEKFMKLQGSVDCVNRCLSQELYDQRLFKLCCMMKNTWFKDTTNLWNLAGMLHKKQHVDLDLMRKTYACVLKTMTDRFDEDCALREFDSWKNSKYHPKLTEAQLKSIANGTDPEGYSKWKDEFEPKEVKVMKTKKKASPDDHKTPQFDDKESRDELSMKLLKSAFDDTTIIEYFLAINHKYKSFDNVLYYFNGVYWVKGSDQYIIQDIDKIYRELYELVQQNYQDEELIKFLKKIISLRSVKYKETLIKGIIGYVRVDADLWDLNDDLVGFVNGVYDLSKDLFRAGTYDDYISMVIGYEYSESTEDQLEMVEKYFNKIMPVEEERDLFLLLLSTILSGRHLEKFVVCTGSGRNGKDTTFTYLMKHVFGPYYYSCNPTAFTQKIKSDQNVSIANFDKKRLVITSEPDKDETIKTAMVKALTGSDETAMRTLYSQKTKVNLNETLFMLCNDKPALDHSEQAMLERLIVIPFRCTFKTAQFMKDNELTEGENYVYTADERIKSSEYLDEMKLPTFNYLLPYFRKFRSDGYLIQSIPESIKQLNESYMEDSDEFMNWFNSEYERTKSKDDILKLADVFSKYSSSDFYDNLTKKEKRANNKGRFIEKAAANVSLKIFYKDRHQPMIKGKQVVLRNILTNYKVRVDADKEDS